MIPSRAMYETAAGVVTITHHQASMANQASQPAGQLTSSTCLQQWQQRPCSQCSVHWMGALHYHVLHRCNNLRAAAVYHAQPAKHSSVRDCVCHVSTLELYHVYMVVSAS
jgi:hypothetical protein